MEHSFEHKAKTIEVPQADMDACKAKYPEGRNVTGEGNHKDLILNEHGGFVKAED